MGVFCVTRRRQRPPPFPPPYPVPPLSLRPPPPCLVCKRSLSLGSITRCIGHHSPSVEAREHKLEIAQLGARRREGVVGRLPVHPQDCRLALRAPHRGVADLRGARDAGLGCGGGAVSFECAAGGWVRGEEGSAATPPTRHTTPTTTTTTTTPYSPPSPGGRPGSRCGWSTTRARACRRCVCIVLVLMC